MTFEPEVRLGTVNQTLRIRELPAIDLMTGVVIHLVCAMAASMFWTAGAAIYGLKTAEGSHSTAVVLAREASQGKPFSCSLACDSA